MFVNSDFSDLLKLFNDKKVKYLIIGGYAVVQYAEPRYTKDLDIWINTDTTNASSVYEALKEFGAPLAELTEKDFAEEGYFYQMGVPPVRVDILMGIPGVAFEEAWKKGQKSNGCVSNELRRFPVRVDILMGIPGIEFEAAWKKRVKIEFDGLLLSFISKEDLIIAKRASGRPQDLIDADALEKVVDE